MGNGNDWEYLSYMQLLLPSALDAYAKAGFSSNASLFIITAAERDAAPIKCDANGQFLTDGSPVPNWVNSSRRSL